MGKTRNDFSDDEKKSVIEEISQKPCDINTLSKNYETSKKVIIQIVREAGFPRIPDDLSKHPDFPKKSDKMSNEDYKIAMKKYWELRKFAKYPDFPKQSDDMSDEEYKKVIREFYKAQKTKTDKPQKTEGMSNEEYYEAVKKYFNSKGLKHFSDFNEDELKSIVKECTIDLIGPKKLSQKYKTAPHFITRIVRKAGFSITPDHLGKYSDIPKNSDDMSDEEY